MKRAPRQKIWFVANVMSGSYDPAMCERIVGALESGHGDVTHMLRIPDEELPDRATLEAAGVDMIAVFSGDGTVSNLIHRAEGWEGSLLVLPGGTMNLLCKTLHASVDAIAIIERAREHGRSAPVPVVEGSGQTALTGIVAGPTAAWGKVREAMRHGDVARLAELVPDAWRRSLDDVHGVTLEGDPTVHPALFVSPTAGGLRVSAFTVHHLGEVARHGFAWLSGDFRNGPHIELGTHEAVTISSQGNATISMLVDGEQAEAPSPVKFEREFSSLQFVRTVG